MSKQHANKKVGLACGILFLSPFLLAGLAAFGSGIWEYYTTGHFTEDIGARLGVGSIFSLVGGGLMVAMFYGGKKEKRQAELQQSMPDTPWLWQQDWAEGRVQTTTSVTMFVYWFFGFACGLGSLPIILNFEEIQRKGPMGYVALFFPLAAILMIGAAIYTTLRHFKYGRTHCDLLSNPGVVGGWFRAVIWAKLNLAPGDTVETQLTCFHCYTSGTGKNRSSHRKVKWQETKTITREYLATNADGLTAIPVKIYIPRDCTPTTPGKPENRREWELTATAKVAGIDFLSQFIVPVFVTSESQDTPPADLNVADDVVAVTPFHPTINVLEGVDSLELHGPPRRNVSATFSVFLFASIWTIIIVAMLYGGGIPLLFPIVFGFIDLLLVAMAIWMLFGHVRIRIEHGQARIRSTVFGIGRTTIIPLDRIQGVDSHINMQSGNTAYYAIRLRTTSGKKNTVSGIRNKDEVNALIRLLEEAIEAGKTQ